MDWRFPGNIAVFDVTCYILTLVVGANVLGEVMYNSASLQELCRRHFVCLFVCFIQ